MNAYVSIQQAEGDSISMTPEEIAAQVLEILGGDPEKDICTVQIASAPVTGTAGQLPPLPPPPETA